MRDRGLVIAIDGPSGAGKSSAGRKVADRLGYVFLDTGAMYRALALKTLRTSTAPDQAAAVAAVAHETAIDLTPDGRVLLDGEDVTVAIRTRDVTGAASRISVHPAVRRELVARQQELGRRGGVVMDGRDIGTAVFPDADLKFYVDADARKRAMRRREELLAAGTEADLDTIEAEIRARDHADSTRSDSPLTRARDAVPIDTTNMDLAEAVAAMMRVVNAKLGR